MKIKIDDVSDIKKIALTVSRGSLVQAHTREGFLIFSPMIFLHIVTVDLPYAKYGVATIRLDNRNGLHIKETCLLPGDVLTVLSLA